MPPPPHVVSDALWVEENKGFSFSIQGRNTFGRGPSLLVWASDLIREGVMVVPWMAERLAEVPHVGNQPLGCRQNSLRLCLLECDEDPLGSFWGASETCWDVCTIEIGYPLPTDCYSPQEQEERKHMEPGRKDPPSCSALCGQSVTLASWQRRSVHRIQLQHHKARQWRVSMELRSNK